MSEKKVQSPLLFNVAKWYGYLFSLAFILYGGVEIILGFMDHNYENFASYLIFLLLGFIFLTIVIAFRDLKVWGWYCLLGLNGLIILSALFHIKAVENIILLILSGIALYALLEPGTKNYILKKR
ncbi:MAG: hypothetical protein ACOYVF_04135 [Candidatus Zixiibacteriota bacterium]